MTTHKMIQKMFAKGATKIEITQEWVTPTKPIRFFAPRTGAELPPVQIYRIVLTPTYPT